MARIKQSELEKFFLKYGDTSALDSVFASSPTFQNAARGFNINRRSPGMAEDVIPGVEPTVIPKLEKAPWLVSMQGEGPKYQQKPTSMLTYLRKFGEQEQLQAREQIKIKILIAQNPTKFIGRPAETFINSKEAEEYLKNQGKAKIAVKKLAETYRHNKAVEEAKNPGPLVDLNTGTIRSPSVVNTGKLDASLGF